MKLHLGILAAAALLAAAVNVQAHPYYIGYSGAPGSSGQCSGSCHGTTGGTIQVSGFPPQYVAGQVYTVTISHAGGATITQFNGSCRIGTGSQNAGTIAGGTNTVTYNTTGETNGIHFSAQSLDSGTFSWTAPATGTGAVTLYVCGHQGTYGGANTVIALQASEQASGVDAGAASQSFWTSSYPNPFTARTTIGYYLPHAAAVLVEIFDASGRTLQSYGGEQAAGYHRYTWDASGRPSGTYFYRVQAGDRSETRKIQISR